jgi:hypothetical protein
VTRAEFRRWQRAHRKLTDGAVEALVQRVQAGERVKVVAEDLGISDDAALVYCYRAGVIPRYVRRQRSHRMPA